MVNYNDVTKAARGSPNSKNLVVILENIAVTKSITDGNTFASMNREYNTLPLFLYTLAVSEAH